MPPKRRRRFQGLYYHSSPPKVLPMNGHINESGRKRKESDDFSVKLATIRIWIHEKDIGKLTRILWAGQGGRLRQQASNNNKVKRFLAAVPYAMNSIRDVHQAVIDNSLETLQAKLEPPVPPALVTCRDANGLNLIHKAAGLGHATILEYLIATWPDGVNECDITGKTPLHWAASAKNNMRCYTLLTQAGCDEEAVDYKVKTPSFYRHKPHEIERAFLMYVPDAPRVSPEITTDWEALSDDSGDGKKPDIKIQEINGFGRQSITESNENTSEAEMTEGPSATEDEDAGGGNEDVPIENGIAEQEEEEAAPVEPEEDETQPLEEDAKDEAEAEAEEEAAAEDAAPEDEEPQDEKQTQSLNESHATTTINNNDSETHSEEQEENKATASEENAENEIATESNEGNDGNDKNEIVPESNGKSEDAEEITDTAVAESNEHNEEEDHKEEEDNVAEDNEEEKTIVEESKESASDEKEQVNELEISKEDVKEDDKEDIKEEVIENGQREKREANGKDEKEEQHENEENSNEKGKHDDENDNETDTEQLNDEANEEENDVKVIEEEPETVEENEKADEVEEASLIENETEKIIPEIETEDVNQEEDVSQVQSESNEDEASEPTTKVDVKANEDENNNTNTKEDNNNDEKSITDNVEKELCDISEEIQENGESFLKEAKHEISDKFEEISQNLKENVKELSNKIKNVFTSADEHTATETDADGNENDVIVRPDSHKSNSKPNGKVNNGNNDESSDDANESEDEEPIANVITTEEVDSGLPNDEAEIEIVDVDEEDDDVEDDDDGDGGTESPTSSMAIEGFITGDAEDNTVQSQTAAYVDDDEETRISRVIASGDMEQLAQIVLNGDGQKLLDVEATEPEIQAFLRNVPNYMDKIRRVHEASRGGSLLNLQQALDRRKFAVAKDELSPSGATPLHVAVLFGHSDIVRYLAARFPETTTVADNDGRTALHYAAVIDDNGHFYNVLLQLGSNPKAVDKNGKTPEEYLGNDDLKKSFNYGLLLKKFNAEELESQLLSDQGQVENPSFQENPIFKTEQGKYLAENLADPLVKALTQVAHKRPQDPLQYLASYLQNFAATRNTNGRTVVQAAVHSGSSNTNSTALVNSNPSPAAEARQYQPTNRMNGHVKYDNSNEIEEDSLQYLEDEDGDEAEAALSKKLEDRDEHGQSMLHFASARSHRRGGLLQLIEESKPDITYRDELYRTARDVALQANQVGNAKDIDRYLISLAVVGDLKPFEYFAINGYDHIIDVMDDNEVSIIDLAESKGHIELATFLRGVRPLEEMREELHQMIRDNNVSRVKEIAESDEGKWLVMAKNYYGRTALHIAILKESEELVEHFVKLSPEGLKISDNLERTPLHYAMGSSLVESLSRILIQNGAKRTNKDLKGRQPSYYFMNKSDILRLQEEEDENR